MPEDKARESFTDPDSRIMQHGNKAWEQSYDGHTAVDATNQIVVAAELSQNASDSDRLPPMLEAVETNLGRVPEQTLADAGFRSEAVLERLAETPTDLIVALGREGKKRAAINKETHPRTAAMAERFETEEVKAAYRRRKHVVEAPNGWIKSVLGFRQFSLRGFEKASAEWKIVSAALNLRGMAYL